MSLTKLNANLNAHQSLPDQPSLTTDELKREWDRPVNDVKDFINNTLTTEIDTALGKKVEAVQGKKLSTEDYTTAEKNKLASMRVITSGTEIPTGGQDGDIYIQYFE